MDRIEATIAELTSTQLKLTAVVDAMVTKLSNLLQRLALRDATQHFPSSSPAKSPPTDAPISIPLPMSTSIPCLAPKISQALSPISMIVESKSPTWTLFKYQEPCIPQLSQIG